MKRNKWRNEVIHDVLWCDKHYGPIELRVTDYRKINVPKALKTLLEEKCNWKVIRNGALVASGSSRWVWLAKIKAERAYKKLIKKASTVT